MPPLPGSFPDYLAPIVRNARRSGARYGELQQTVARLLQNSKDAYLPSGLAVTKNGRGDKTGQAFSELKSALGFGEWHSFHSWRATAITMLEHAGVPESTVQDIVGHERSTLTGSTSSGKTTFEMRRKALAKLAYPKRGGT